MTAKKATKLEKTSVNKKQIKQKTNSRKALILVVFGLAIIFIVIVSLVLMPRPNHDFDSLQYDIIVEKHHNRDDNLDPSLVSAGGYATIFHYTLVNSGLHEKYTIVYQDVWEIHNERGDRDTVTITTEAISDEELNDLITKYGKQNYLSSAKQLLEDNIKEPYIVVDDNR